MPGLALKVGQTRGEFYRLKKDWESFDNPGAWSRLRKVLNACGLAREPWRRTNYPESTTGTQFLDIPVQVPKREFVASLQDAGFDVIHDDDAPELVSYREARLIKAYVNEVLTGFKSLNTAGRDGVAGNVSVSAGGKNVIQQRGNILDDIEDEDDDIDQGCVR